MHGSSWGQRDQVAAVELGEDVGDARHSVEVAEHAKDDCHDEEKHRKPDSP